MLEIPQYGLRAYALFFSRHGTEESFKQSELEWSMSQSMKKKIFALLLRAGWIRKETRNSYKCNSPEKIIKGLLDFRVPEIIKQAKKPYAFTNMSAIEIWSDYVYIQRGIERSPYFIKILKKDIKYWKELFNKNNIPNYVNKGSTIGEYIILIPVERITSEKKDGFRTETLKKTLKIAEDNEMYSYAYKYMRDKYAAA
ncbi:MAG: hypothetical protein ISS25_03490 [Nanoarchaeota archaeon]|nr:hypothetical protein [DPANN group archaeon]MBL7116865.1 hypothetical protein [Nanoarchaeota archaeon]